MMMQPSAARSDGADRQSHLNGKKMRTLIATILTVLTITCIGLAVREYNLAEEVGVRVTSGADQGKWFPLKTFASETRLWRNDMIVDKHMHYIDDECKVPAGSTYIERPFDDYPAERYYGSANWEEDEWKRVQIIGGDCDHTVGFMKMNAAEITSAKARATEKLRQYDLKQLKLKQITEEPHKCATGAGSALACAPK
jgi:hypothetical protein